MIATEEAAAANYDKQTKANAIEKATKDQDVKYKSKEAHELDEAVAEATSDRSGVQAELDAVNEYLEKLVEDCVAKPETYAERKARREAEIAGLNEALSILRGEAVLLQTSTALRGTMRGLLVRVHSRCHSSSTAPRNRSTARGGTPPSTSAGPVTAPVSRT